MDSNFLPVEVVQLLVAKLGGGDNKRDCSKSRRIQAVVVWLLVVELVAPAPGNIPAAETTEAAAVLDLFLSLPLGCANGKPMFGIKGCFSCEPPKLLGSGDKQRNAGWHLSRLVTR